MDQLLSLPCVPDIRDFLGKLPEDLERAYDEILDRINSQKGRTPEIARRAFLWVMCSCKPLTPGMLVDAVCQDPETRATNPLDIDINTVLEACRGLVIIDRSDICRFSHLSVQEYLETYRYRNSQAHLLVGTVCLQILLDLADWHIVENAWLAFEPVERINSILLYSVAYWPIHARLHAEECVDDRLQSLVKEFLGSPKEGSAVYMRWSGACPRYSDVTISLSSGPVYAIVFFHLNQILSNWWTYNINVDSRDEYELPLIHMAGLTGNMTAAVELLNLGANPNIQHMFHGGAVYAAAFGGNEGIVSLLLDRGVNINAQGGTYGNALQTAVYRGSEVIVRLLLDRGADIHAQGGHFGNALQAAVYLGNEAIVRILLDREPNIHTQGGHLGNALQAAACGGNEAIVHLLLDRGAGIHVQGGYYGNALQAAASTGSEAIVRLLLDLGADINACGGEFGNALQAATHYGREAVVRLLLDRGANIHAQGGYLCDMFPAARSNDTESLYFESYDEGEGYYVNALQASVHLGWECIASLLLDRGADINNVKEHLDSCVDCRTRDLSPAVKRALLAMAPK